MRLKGVGHAGFQAPQALVGVHRKDGRVGLLLQAVQPFVILVVAAHVDQIAANLLQHSFHSGMGRHKIVQEAQFAWVAFRVALGGAVRPRQIGEGAQIAGLKNQIDLLAGLLLPAGAELEGQQNPPMHIRKHRNIHYCSSENSAGKMPALQARMPAGSRRYKWASASSSWRVSWIWPKCSALCSTACSRQARMVIGSSPCQGR